MTYIEREESVEKDSRVFWLASIVMPPTETENTRSSLGGKLVHVQHEVTGHPGGEVKSLDI